MLKTVKKYLPVKGSQIYYETSGEGEPVLLMHGGFGTVEDFSHQTPELAKHFKVVAFERPGHGHTADNTEPFHFDTMTEYTIGFIEKLDLGPVNLVGWSDGAIIALLVSISRPVLAKRMVCIGTSFNTRALPPQALAWIKSSTPESFRRDEEILVKRYYETSPDGPAHFPIVFEKTIKMWLNEPDIRKEDLAKVRASTLVMVADRDAVIPEHTLELWRSIRDAQLCVIPGATHFLLSEKPDMANKAILEFLLDGPKAKTAGHSSC